MFRIKAPLRTVCASFLYVFVCNTFILFTFAIRPLSVRAKSICENAYQKCAKMHQLFRIRAAKTIVLGVDLLIIVQCM